MSLPIDWFDCVVYYVARAMHHASRSSRKENKASQGSIKFQVDPYSSPLYKDVLVDEKSLFKEIIAMPIRNSKKVF